MTVSVQNLTKIYGKQKAVNELNFTISKGEVVGFLGPNGAGKSTTMKILSCFIEPTSGDASVCGANIYDDPVEVRKHIGYLPEHNPLYLDMYVKEYLQFSARMQHMGNAGKKIAQVIEQTGLGLEQRKKIGQLSKGYRQRVGLAQALLHNPEVLILDEPTSGLDPLQIKEIRDLIKEVGREKTVILSTHIMQEVQAMCDRVMIINRGNIVADNSLDEILAHFTGQMTLRVEFKQPMKNQLIAAIDGVEKVVHTENKYLVHSRATDDVREKIFELAVAQNNPILRMEPIFENLEDIFRQLTQEQNAV
ncbi:gliding motility-associated ABC transporter ATP-binding subunit GldA [bacterium]|nr:gliding motility-associated ABC transporter ATP-binding subunit GldA [bacterium]